MTVVPDPSEEDKAVLVRFTVPLLVKAAVFNVLPVQLKVAVAGIIKALVKVTLLPVFMLMDDGLPEAMVVEPPIVAVLVPENVKLPPAAIVFGPASVNAAVPRNVKLSPPIAIPATVSGFDNVMEAVPVPRTVNFPIDTPVTSIVGMLAVPPLIVTVPPTAGTPPVQFADKLHNVGPPAAPPIQTDAALAFLMPSTQ